MKDTLALLQGYYSYFLLSLYTDILLKEGKIEIAGKWPSGESQDVVLSLGSWSAIRLNTKRINTLLTQIKANPTSKNVYGFLSFISSLKWVFGVFLDMEAKYLPWRRFLQKTLGKEYDGYMQTVRFCRNLLTHQHSTKLQMSARDKESALFRFAETGKRIISLSFSYKELFGSYWKGTASYGFHTSINTETLKTKKTLFSIIDEHTLFMLAESVFNITEYYLVTSGKTTSSNATTNEKVVVWITEVEWKTSSWVATTKKSPENILSKPKPSYQQPTVKKPTPSHKQPTAKKPTSSHMQPTANKMTASRTQPTANKMTASRTQPTTNKMTASPTTAEKKENLKPRKPYYAKKRT